MILQSLRNLGGGVKPPPPPRYATGARIQLYRRIVVENSDWPESHYNQPSYICVYFKVVSDSKWIAKMICTMVVITQLIGQLL